VAARGEQADPFGEIQALVECAEHNPKLASHLNRESEMLLAIRFLRDEVDKDKADFLNMVHEILV
jgi:hypothetical protein